MIDSDEKSEFENLLKRDPLAKDSAYRRLAHAIAGEARQAESIEWHWRLQNGLNVLDDIARAVNRDVWYDRNETPEKLVLWRHDDRPQLIGKKRLEPYIPLESVEIAATSYLDLSYRVPALDRLLVEMLIAAEMYAFADEIQPFLRRKLPPILGWLVGNVIGLVVGLGIAAVIGWLGNGSTVTNWIAGIIAALTVLTTAWSLIAFPFLYPKLRVQHRRLENIINAMRDAYAALGGSPASAKHIEAQVAKATDAGAVWPSQLIVLLEDIRARRQTI